MVALAGLKHPDISEEMKSEIDALITSNKTTRGAVITVLRECQDVVGYLPLELIDYIGSTMGIPASEVYGVASFYKLFSMKPKGRHTIKMCLGTACYVKGINGVMNRVCREHGLTQGCTSDDRRFSLEAVRCLGACGLAPVMVVDQDTHGTLSADEAVDILSKYK